MTSTLRERVFQVQTAAGRLRWGWALGQLVTWELVALTLLAAFDYGVRFSGPVGRWLLTLAVLAVTWRLVQRFLRPCLAGRPDLVRTALRIEARYPQLASHLSTAVAFLEMPEHDPAAGSPAMRQAVISRADSLTQRLDLHAVLDAGPTRRALLRALAAVLAIGGLVGWQPQAARIALIRLTMPWSAAAWPRQHDLAFVDPPRRVAAGSPLTLTLIDRQGKLPEVVEVLLETRAAPGGTVQVRRLTAGGPTLEVKLESVSADLRYRARGGDDDTMPWQTLEVVPPPTLREVQLRVVPPPYTGQPPHNAGTTIRAVAGSLLELTAVWDRPLAGVVLRFSQANVSLPATPHDGGRRWTVGHSPPWQLVQSDTAMLELRDTDGTRFTPLMLRIEVFPDQPPALVWSSPDGEVVATPQARLHLQARVQDDYGVQQIALQATPAEGGSPVSVPLYLAEAPPASRPAQDASAPAELSPAGDLVTVDTAWDLAGLGAQPGQVWSLVLTADDFKPQTAHTPPRRLMIVSPVELLRRVAARQPALLLQLAEALRLARQVEDALARAEHRAAQGLTGEEVLRLQAARYSLQQLGQMLGPEGGGAEAALAALLAELDANRLAHDELGQRLNEWLAQLRHLNGTALPAVGQSLTEALETIPPDLSSDSAPTRELAPPAAFAALAAARREQTALVQGLSQLLGRAHRWESLSQLAERVSQMRQGQQSLTAELEKLHVEALTDPADRAATRRAQSRRLAQQQGELARQAEEMLAAMEELRPELAQEDPQAALRLEAARAAWQRQAISGTMREGAVRLAQGQYEQAASLARQALEGLRELETLLQGEEGVSSPSSASPPAQEDWPAQLKMLIAPQRELVARIQQYEAASVRPPAPQASEETAALADRQRTLATQLGTLLPRLPGVFRSAAAAAHLAMQQGSQRLEAGEAFAAGQAAQTALGLLEQIAQATTPEGTEAETPAGAPLTDGSSPPDHLSPAELRLMLLWQQWIARQTAELDRQRPADGQWTDAQRGRILELARQQQLLAETVKALLGTLPDADAPRP